MMFTINLLPCVCVSSHVYVLSSSLARTNPVVDASAGIWVVCLVDIGSHIHLGIVWHLLMIVDSWPFQFIDEPLAFQYEEDVVGIVRLWRQCHPPLSPHLVAFTSVATTNTSRRRNYWAAGYTFVLTALHRLIKDHHATIWWNDNITIIINTTSTRFTTVRGTWFPTKVWTKFRTCHGCTQNRLSTIINKESNIEDIS